MSSDIRVYFDPAFTPHPCAISQDRPILPGDVWQCPDCQRWWFGLSIDHFIRWVSHMDGESPTDFALKQQVEQIRADVENEWRTVHLTDELLERIGDAIDTAMGAHQSLDNDSRCSCGARNNMDGDVLHAHRVGAVRDAALKALGVREAVA